MRGNEAHFSGMAFGKSQKITIPMRGNELEPPRYMVFELVRDYDPHEG